jgi:hypothetical protein
MVLPHHEQLQTAHGPVRWSDRKLMAVPQDPMAVAGPTSLHDPRLLPVVSVATTTVGDPVHADLTGVVDGVT